VNIHALRPDDALSLADGFPTASLVAASIRIRAQDLVA